MSKRKLSVTQKVHGPAAQNRPSETLGLRSSSRLNLGRATGGASALALAFAFLAPKPAAAVPFFENISATLPEPDPYCAGVGPSSASQPLPRQGCFTSWLVATDLDSDGDLDVLLANGGGYYVPNENGRNPNYVSVEPSTVYLNDGTGTFTDVTGPMFNNAASRLRQVAVADVDGNGLKDVYQPGGYSYACAALAGCVPDADKLWMQMEKGVFVDKAAELLPQGLMSNAPAAHFGDLDGDGDIDLVTTDWLTSASNTPVFLTMYLNDGTGKFVLEEEQQDPDNWIKSDRFPATIPFTNNAGSAYWGSRAIDLDFADIDNDFDLDILVNMRNGISRIFLNDGSGHFKDGNGKVEFYTDPATGTVLTRSNYPMKRGPYVYNQELCDVDNDGDLDLLLDNAAVRPTGGSSNFTQVNINDGTGKFKDESRERILDEVGSDDNAVKCADLNNDGWYDLMVASLNGTRPDKLLLNDGAGKFKNVADGIPLSTPGATATLGIDAADFNGDGLLDLFTGQGEGGSDWRENYFKGIISLDPVTGESVGAKADTRAPIIRTMETPVPVPGKPIVVRFSVRDQVTSETGDHVKDVALVYTTPFGSGGKVAAKFIGGDLFRAVIPAQEAGTTLAITAQATDRGNRKGFGPQLKVVIKEAPSSGGSGGTGGTGGAGGTGGTGGTTAGTGGTDIGGEGGVAGEAPVAGAGGAEEPSMGGAGAGPGPEPMGGEPGTSGSSTGGSTSTGATSSVGGEPSEGGAPSTGGTTSGGTTSGGSGGGGDDDGCSVSTTASSSSGGGWLAALGLALMAGRRRRSKRSE